MPITDQGYVVDTTREIIDAMASDAITSYDGLDVDASDNSVLGILLGLVATQINQQSQTLGELFNGQDPDTAEGKSLDNLAYRNGILRKGAAPSTAYVTFTNNTGVEQVLLEGTKVVSTLGDEFTTDEEITLATAVGSTSSVVATCLKEGPVEASINSINSYPGGGESVLVTNNSAASVGSLAESDSQLRNRLKRFLQAGGNSTIGAIEAAVSNIAGVTDVAVVSNSELDPVDRGLNRPDRPGKSFEVVVEGGNSNDIAEAIALSKPAGITSFGDEYILNQDPLATIGLTRPEVFNVVLDLSYELYSEEVLPNGVESTMRKNMVDFASEEFTLGKDLICHRLACSASTGVQGVGAVYVSISLDGVDYTNDRIIMEVFQKGLLLDENITLTKRIDFNAN